MPQTKSGEHYESAHLIERQMLFHEARDRATREGRGPARGARYRFITISRRIGSLGGEIAQAVAGHTGWRTFDREIVDHIAQSAHVRQRLVEQLDEKAQNLIHETVRRVLRMAEGGSFGLEEYHEGLLRTLAGLAAHGEAILVGRGANFALRGHVEGLHVRVVSSDEVRVQRLCGRWQLPTAEALRRMHEVDAERAGFIRHHFKQDIDDPRFYDLILNTDCITPPHAALAILALI